VSGSRLNSRAAEFLSRGAAGLRPYLQDSGELHDPVFDEPTQYGTAYYGYVNSALAALATGAETDEYRSAARRGLEATLRHLLNPGDPHPPTTRYYPAVGSPSAANLRDFMWLPVLRGLRLLTEQGDPAAANLAKLVAEVDVPGAFNKRGPVNWATVWIAGEWLRICDGMSPYSADAIDQWLEPFFASAIDVERGLYREPGLPNTYDLFTRVHLLYLLVDGYQGAFRDQLDRLVTTGLRRSLGVQLSSGSLASAHRSTGQVWTLGAECSYFFHAARYLEDTDQELAALADRGAVLALNAAEQCFRANGELSPAENVFPASDRIGYEVYTSDPHYVALPLGFFATAVLNGFTGEPAAVAEPAPRVFVDPVPMHRALIHASGWSVHLDLDPKPGYDAPEPKFDGFGIADITFGPGRVLRFGGQARHPATQTPLALGLGIWQPDGSLQPLSAVRVTHPGSIRASAGHLEATAVLTGVTYRVQVDIDGDLVRITEDAGTPPVSLLIPYLRDRGDGVISGVELHDDGVTISRGGESVRIACEGPVRRKVHLTHGHESRHGLLGLVRLDLAEPGPVSYQIQRLR
jgi:hypothetical protein